jgi:hypothetical protein
MAVQAQLGLRRQCMPAFEIDKMLKLPHSAGHMKRMNQRGEGEIGVLIGLVLLVIIGVWVYNHWLKPDTWSLFYDNHLGITVRAGDYRSRDECAAKLQVARQNPSMSHPECGSNCEPPETIDGAYICDETFEL